MLKLTLLDMHEREINAMLKTRFMAERPAKTMHGRSVIGAGLGTESRGWFGLLCAFENEIIAVRIRANDTIMTRIARTRT
jgi:hypothetical protein